MTDKYQQIIDCLETPMLFEELSKATGIVRGSLHLMLARLLEAGKVTREKMESTSRQKFYIYTRLVETVKREEVIYAKNYKKIAEERKSLEGVLPNARVVRERHVPSEKRQSPRVYVGCSFNQVGW